MLGIAEAPEYALITFTTHLVGNQRGVLKGVCIHRTKGPGRCGQAVGKVCGRPPGEGGRKHLGEVGPPGRGPKTSAVPPGCGRRRPRRPGWGERVQDIEG